MLYNKPISVNRRVQEIIKIIQNGKELDYTTKTFYQKRLICELERLNNLLFIVPEAIQMDIKNNYIEKIKGALETLENRDTKNSLYDNLATRLEAVGRNVKEL